MDLSVPILLAATISKYLTIHEIQKKRLPLNRLLCALDSDIENSALKWSAKNRPVRRVVKGELYLALANCLFTAFLR
jgi:hypothetical protein